MMPVVHVLVIAGIAVLVLFWIAVHLPDDVKLEDDEPPVPWP